MSEQDQIVELNEDTIIHVVRQCNQRGVSAKEKVDEQGKVVGLTITRGERVDVLTFGGRIVFGVERDIRFEEKPKETAEEEPSL